MLGWSDAKRRGRLLGDQRARKIHFIAAAVRGSDKVSWSHAPRNI